MSAQVHKSVLNSRYARASVRFHAWKLSRQASFSFHEREDLQQELWAALIAQSPKFDPKRAAASTFIKRVVRSRAAMLLRARRIEGRSAPVRVRDTSSAQPAITEFTDASDQRSSLTTFAESRRRSELHLAIHCAMEQMPPELRSICETLMEHPVSAVARKLGISRRQVQNAIETLRESLTFSIFGPTTNKADKSDSVCICDLKRPDVAGAVHG